jgi:hypothetical protein
VPPYCLPDGLQLFNDFSFLAMLTGCGNGHYGRPCQYTQDQQHQCHFDEAEASYGPSAGYEFFLPFRQPLQPD